MSETNLSTQARELIVPPLLNIPPKLTPIITEFNNYTYFLLNGGRGSGKTQSIARLLLHIGGLVRLTVVCAYEVEKRIDEGMHKELEERIVEYGLDYKVTDKKIVHRRTGTEFRFMGLKGLGPAAGKGLAGVNILWVDEAQALTKATLTNLIPTVLRNKNPKLFFSMNRHYQNDPVWEMLHEGKKTLTLTCNYNDNPFITEHMVEEALELKERNEAEYKHVWLGEPLSQFSDTLIDATKIEAAQKADFGAPTNRSIAIGFDFAAQGGDMCVATILTYHGGKRWAVHATESWNSPDTAHSIGRIVNILTRYNPTAATIDLGGMGKVVFDRLREIGHYNITPFDGGSTMGVDTKTYANIRAAAYFNLQIALDEGTLGLASAHQRAISEISKIRFKYRSSGARLIWSKQELRPIMQGSPDYADSLAMALWVAMRGHNGIGAKPMSDAGSTIKRVLSKSLGARRRGRR